MEERKLYKRYFRKKGPECRPEDIEWIEMSGNEFYRFVTSPDGEKHHFIDMGDVVLESSEAQARKYREELNHSYYIRTYSEGHDPLSLYSVEDRNGCSGEEVAIDESQNVEYVSAAMIKCKKTPREKCRKVAEESEKR